MVHSIANRLVRHPSPCTPYPGKPNLERARYALLEEESTLVMNIGYKGVRTKATEPHDVFVMSWLDNSLADKDRDVLRDVAAGLRMGTVAEIELADILGLQVKKGEKVAKDAWWLRGLEINDAKARIIHNTMYLWALAEVRTDN